MAIFLWATFLDSALVAGERSPEEQDMKPAKEPPRSDLPQSPFRLHRLRHVLIQTRRLGECYYNKVGTVIWQARPDSGSLHPLPRPWFYCVYVPFLDVYQWFLDPDLEPLDQFDDVRLYYGVRPELSFDTEAADDMEVIEGCYRLPGRFWEVFEYRRRGVPQSSRRRLIWPSGIAGIVCDVPMRETLSIAYVISSMSRHFHVAAREWSIVRGPDSFYMAMGEQRPRAK